MHRGGDVIAKVVPNHRRATLKPMVQAIAGVLSPARRCKALMKGRLRRPQYLRDGQVATASIGTADGGIDLVATKPGMRSHLAARPSAQAVWGGGVARFICTAPRCCRLGRPPASCHSSRKHLQ